MGQRRKVSYKRVVTYTQRHPEARQLDIAEHFKVSQSRVSHILRTAGVSNCHRGKRNGKGLNESEQEKWEKLLQNLGLGMDRGLRLDRKRILYGYDPLKQVCQDDSVTVNCRF